MRRRLFWPTVMTALMLAVLLGLGTWQLQRKAWKDELIAAIQARRMAEPVGWRDVSERFKRGENVEYLRVRLDGTFDHATERYLFWPGRDGQGWHVYTMFRPVGGGQVMLVNRGFVPDALRDPAKRAAGQVTGETTVTGLVRLSERPGFFTPKNDPVRNVWFWRDIGAMTAAKAGPARIDLVLVPPVGPLGYSIDAEAEPANPGGWPQGGATITEPPNRHLEYALTWYGLALTLAAIYAAYARKRVA